VLANEFQRATNFNSAKALHRTAEESAAANKVNSGEHLAKSTIAELAVLYKPLSSCPERIKGYFHSLAVRG
jgi:hypothetical protein